MTATVNNRTATTELKGERIALKLDEQVLVLKVEDVTSVLRVLLAARKEVYALRRKDRSQKDDASKAKRIAKLEKQLQELKKAA